MDLMLNKLLPVFLLPTGFCLALMAVSFLSGRRSLLLAATVLLYGASIGVTGDFLLGCLEDVCPKVKISACPEADAVVVLGGMLDPSESSLEEVAWNDAVDRFEGGLRLMAARKAPVLVFTASFPAWCGAQHPESEMLAAEAVRRGVPRSAIWVGDAINTAGEADTLKALGKKNGREIKNVILVSTAWHLPRARLLFEQRGFSVMPYPVDYRGGKDAPKTAIDYFPMAGNLKKTETAIRECYGILFYAYFMKKSE